MKNILEKIFSFFNSLSEKIKSLILKIRDKIFPSKKDNSLINGMIIGGVIAIILLIAVFSLFYYQGIIGNKKQTNKVVATKVIIVTSKNCNECWDPNLFIDVLNQQNLKIVNKKTVYVDGKSWIPFVNQGKFLVKKYKITKLPTIILDADFDKNQDLTQLLTANNLGEIINGKFILRKTLAPYIDTVSGQLKGKLQITYLTDNSCKECYDVNIHDRALTNLGVPIKNIEKVDISTEAGKKLISDYNIKAVPTILIKGEVKEYQSLVAVWADVGTVAADGTYVFTNLSVMNGAYKDLTKNKVVQPTATK